MGLCRIRGRCVFICVVFCWEEHRVEKTQAILNPRVLIVEDNPIDVLLLKQAL
jgi:hypothetical protein